MKKNFKKYFLIFFSFIIVVLSGLVLFKKYGPKNYPYKISVVIPVYNVEKYLDKCLDSLENQTLKEIEIICVNDGSKDNSLDILKKHAEKDSRVKVIDQKNAGVSAARNKGIRSAKGEYVTFVDSDDFIKEYTYKSCADIIFKENPEIFIYGFRVDEKEEVPQDIDISKCNYYDNGNFMAAYNNSHPAVWDKIFKREFLLKNKIFFKEDVSYAEDYTFTLMALARAKKIMSCSNKFYYYRTDNENSIVNTVKLQKKMESSIKVNKYLLQDFHKLGIYDYDLMFLEEFGKIERYISEEVKDAELKDKYAQELRDVY